MCHFRYRTTSHCRYLSTPPEGSYVHTYYHCCRKQPSNQFLLHD